MSDTQQPTAPPSSYRTKNLALASYLSLYGFSPRVVALDPRQAEFVFDSSPHLHQRIAEYAAGKSIGSIAQFEAHRNTLRTQLRLVLETAADRGSL